MKKLSEKKKYNGSRQGGIHESHEELEELATALSSDEKQ
jgi:hypothetical protein